VARTLFDAHPGRDPKHLYEEMFTMRPPKLLAKVERVRSTYEQNSDAPP
jgi:hypothetical protein